MPTSLRRLLEDDHGRLDRLLAAALAGEAIDVAPYEQFRAGLLRHIGLEEKILLPAARKLNGGQPIDAAKLLRHDHAALVALLVPTPTRPLLETIRALLAAHNPLEEGDDGVYARCERLEGIDADALVQRLEAAPPVPVAAHFDGPRAFDNIDRLLRAAGEARGDAGRFVRARDDAAPP